MNKNYEDVKQIKFKTPDWKSNIVRYTNIPPKKYLNKHNHHDLIIHKWLFDITLIQKISLSFAKKQKYTGSSLAMPHNNDAKFPASHCTNQGPFWRMRWMTGSTELLWNPTALARQQPTRKSEIWRGESLPNWELATRHAQCLSDN